MSTNPRLSHGTVCVPNMDEALALYRDVFEQRVLLDSPVSQAESAAWRAPSIAGARSVVMQPPSGEPVYLRLIEQATPVGYKGGTHYGWNALELSVESADRMYAKLQQEGTPIIAPPKELSFTDKLYPMQARGPGGEALYLNEVRGNLPSSDLPSAHCWVDQLFIVVMGCRDLQASLAFYHALLGTSTGGQWEMPYSVMNISFGLSMDTAHKLATVSDARTVLFELDQYPSIASPKPSAEHGLAPGVAVVGVRCAAAPSRAEWLTPPAPRTAAPYFGATVGVLQGPDGELIECVWD